MPVDPTLRQHFEDFLGLDVQSSHLTRDRRSAIEMVNLLIDDRYSLVCRKGFRQAAQPVYLKHIHTYDYTDTDGVSRQELLGIGTLNYPGNTWYAGNLFRLVKDTIDVVNTLPYENWGISMLPTVGSTVSLRIILNDDGTDILDINVSSTLKSICDQIDALTDYTCSCPKTAVVDGDQTGVSTVTVLTGHTVSVGDWVYIVDRDTGNATFVEVVATTATSLTFFSVGGTRTYDFDDTDIIGVGAFNAFSTLQLRLGDYDESSGATKSLRISYWEMVPSLMHQSANILTDGVFTELNTQDMTSVVAPSCENKNNCCYITAPYIKEIDVVDKVDVSGVITPIPIELEYSTGVWKYDGVSFYCSFLPKVSSSDGFNAANQVGSPGSLPAGIYKYRLSYVYIDAQGNEVEIFYSLPRVVTLASAKDVYLETFVPVHSAGDVMDSRWYNCRSAIVSSGATGATQTVSSGHTLRTGTLVYYYDATNTSYKVAKVVSWTATTVTLDKSITTNTNDVLGTIRARIWRTTVGGSSYFLLTDKITDTGDSDAIVNPITDSTADIALGYSISLFEPEQYQAGLPKGNTLTTHQGVLVVGGGPKLSKQIAWEEPGYLETSPRDTNTEAIIASNSELGDINAILSSAQNELIAICAKGVSKVYGNLPDRQYELDEGSITGIGTDSPYGYVKVIDEIYATGTQGIIALYPQINIGFGKPVRPLSKTRKKGTDTTQILDHYRSFAFYDSEAHLVYFVLPVTEDNGQGMSTIGGTVNDHHTKILVYDVYNYAWYQMQYWRGKAPDAYARFDGNLYHLSTNRLYKHLDGELDEAKYDYINDTNQNVPWSLIPQWDDDNAPRYDKVWQELVFYFLQSDLYITDYTFNLKTFRDWSTTHVAGVDEDRTVSVTADTKESDVIKFNAAVKAKRLTFLITGFINLDNSTIGLTGYEYTILDKAYRRDRLT